MKKTQIDKTQLCQRIESHLINFDAFITDDFDLYFIERAKRLLSVIESAMGKIVADKSSEQTIQQFGCSLE